MTVRTGPVQTLVNSACRSAIIVADWILYSNSSSALKSCLEL